MGGRVQSPCPSRIDQLETPCLLLDIEAIEHNLKTAAGVYRDGPCKIRPHVKNHASPDLAHMQLAAGGTVGGVCVSKVAEAEIMIQGGIPSVLVTNQIVTREKIARLCQLAERADVIVACDDAGNAEQLAKTARERGVTLGVLIEVETGALRRAGVRSEDEGVALAKSLVRMQGVRFRGVMSTEGVRGIPGAAGMPDQAARERFGRQFIGRCVAVRRAIERAGMPVEMASTGETWTWNVAPRIDGVTEVQLGSYLLMDAGTAYLGDFRIAATVLARVVSKPDSSHVVADVGWQALSLSRGMPKVLDAPGVEVEAIDRHRILLATRRDAFHVGDTLRISPGNEDPMIARWDQYIVVRRDLVQAVWDIPGRGCFN